VLAIALALFAAPAMAQSAMVGTGGVDILGQGIFESGVSAFTFPAASNTNYDSIKVAGTDKALAVGAGVGGFDIFGRAFNGAPVVAENSLKIKKNQDTGDSATCGACSPKYNIEQIEVGNRVATAIGAGIGAPFGRAANVGGVHATNSIEILTNQQ
jgi:hypothetical protein